MRIAPSPMREPARYECPKPAPASSLGEALCTTRPRRRRTPGGACWHMTTPEYRVLRAWIQLSQRPPSRWIIQHPNGFLRAWIQLSQRPPSQWIIQHSNVPTHVMNAYRQWAPENLGTVSSRDCRHCSGFCLHTAVLSLLQLVYWSGTVFHGTTGSAGAGTRPNTVLRSSQQPLFQGGSVRQIVAELEPFPLPSNVGLCQYNQHPLGTSTTYTVGDHTSKTSWGRERV